jgi:hypothetical protein
VEVNLERGLDLSAGPIPDELKDRVDRALSPGSLANSMEFAAVLITAKIQGLVFPSVVGGTENLVDYVDHCCNDALTLYNADNLVANPRREQTTLIAAKMRRTAPRSRDLRIESNSSRVLRMPKTRS